MEQTAGGNAATAVAEQKRYRILLPIDREEDHKLALLHFAQALARSCNGEVLGLHVMTPYDESEEGFWQFPQAEMLADVPYSMLNVHHESVAGGILETAREEACDLILLHGRGRPRAFRNRMGHVLDPVVEDAPCDVALLRGDVAVDSVTSDQLKADKLPQNEDTPKQRILVAASGGMHAIGAMQLAFSLARFYGATITLITVIPKKATQKEETAAEEMLAEFMRDAGVSEEEVEQFVEVRILRAENVESTLVSASNKHTMAFLGASSDSIINQLLLGTLVERVSERIPVPTIVVKRYRGLPQYWLRRFWRVLDRAIPDVTAAQQLDTYKRVRRGARATHDFYILMLLSVTIATMGLLLDSAAVIIGAMLVAPLMTPMLGLGLGVVMGDIRLLSVAGRSTLQGTLLGVVISTAMAWVAPSVILTGEIAARTQPNLFDLTVGLAAGAAGAYSISRSSVAAALPGVAIAAALVPPLAVIGIALANSQWEEAAGASLLFGTNLAAISFAGALTYMLLGFFPEEKEEQERRRLLRRGMLVFLLLIFLVTVPLARALVHETTQSILDRRLNDVLRQTISERSDLSLFSFDWERTALPDEPLPIQVVIYSADDVTSVLRQQLDLAISEAIGREVHLRLIAIPINDLREIEEAPVEIVR